MKVNDRCLRVLGCAVAASDECVAADLRDAPKLQLEQRVAFRRLPLMHKQTGMIALRCLTRCSADEQTARYDAGVDRGSRCCV